MTRCAGKIWGDYRDVSGRVYACSRNATVKRDSQWYCWQHDPEHVAADKKKRRAAEDAKQSRRSGMYARRARNARLGALVNEEAMVLLDWLTDMATQVALDTATQYGVDHPLTINRRMRIETARAFAARIREILDEH